MHSDRFKWAIDAIDRANAEDPNCEDWEGCSFPKELLYGRRMSEWLARLVPDASEPLALAARAQHIRRWEISRADYPKTREGYLRWRTRLYGFHGDQLAAIMAEAGYDDASIQHARYMLAKRHLRTDPESQTLEDTACLVFLEHYVAPFALEQDEAKLVDIIRKTWKKMSDQARACALALEFPGTLGMIMARALAQP